MRRALFVAIAMIAGCYPSGTTATRTQMPSVPRAPSGARLPHASVLALMEGDVRRLLTAVSAAELAVPSGHCAMKASTSFDVRTFDDRGRIVAAESDTAFRRYTYSPDGRRLMVDVKYKERRLHTDRSAFLYDDHGRLLAREWTHRGQECSTRQTYDYSGCLRAEHRGCGANENETRFDVAASCRITRVVEIDSVGDEDTYEVQYENDRRVRFVSVEDGQVRRTFTYDARGRLVSDGKLQVTYDDGALTVSVRGDMPAGQPFHYTLDYACRLLE